MTTQGNNFKRDSGASDSIGSATTVSTREPSGSGPGLDSSASLDFGRGGIFAGMTSNSTNVVEFPILGSSGNIGHNLRSPYDETPTSRGEV